MNRYSVSSLKHLESVHTDLIQPLASVLPYFDHVVIEGARTLDKQRENVRKGASKTLKSKHVIDNPEDPRPVSDAVDVAPYVGGRIPWPARPAFFDHLTAGDRRELTEWLKDYATFYYFAGHVMQAAHARQIPIRWGGDWDSDTDLLDQSFDDLVHFERA